MKQNKYPAKQNSRKVGKLASGALAIAATLSMSGDAKATTQHDPHKAGGDGKQHEYQWTPNSDVEASAAADLAQGLSGALNPKGHEKGSAGPNSFTIMDGTITFTVNGGKVEVNDPIVASTERPVDMLSSGWIVIQSKDKQGNIRFESLNLSHYPGSVVSPLDPQNPYRTAYGTSQPVKDGPTPESPLYRMFECDSTGTVADVDNLSAPGWATFTPDTTKGNSLPAPTPTTVTVHKI